MATQIRNSTSSYTFTSNPRPISPRGPVARKPKYRDEAGATMQVKPVHHILSDPRIIKGTTAPNPFKTAQLQAEKQLQSKPRRQQRKLKESSIFGTSQQPSDAPEPVEGRKRTNFS
jgi:hypothetical protein